ncbi:polysaccharide pyruvyl transferase family protein [Natrinema hispanicum]|uniref:Polysaccharide pyruvyl transferase family protein WcaK n=1 Tax=Natrinema hispanicum TaxID=392421 RepID=A0A1I0J6N5_9EURY|nr:polysaccharide pyruvyl transferase family protein [Natrinema hispanicum]SEU04850.1 Polysaccharide pyruvyl transferase family protein WcaK [Natrinema hispanicum]
MESIKYAIRNPLAAAKALPNAAQYRVKRRIPHDIGVQGSYDTGNIGDRALGEQFKVQLEQKGYRTKLFRRGTTASNASKRILGGGGVLHDWYGVAHLKKRLKYVSSGEEGYAIGVGVPGFHSKEARSLASRVLPELDLITVRDQWSKSNIEAVCDADVTVTACPVFLYDDPQETTSSRTGVNFRPYFGEKDDISNDVLKQYFGYTELEDATERYIRNAQQICESIENPVFIPFTPKDEKFAQKHLDIPIWPYEFSVEKTLKRVSSVDRMVATRYHSLIFAAICRKPILPLAYEPKVEQVAERLDLPYYKPHKDIEIEFSTPSNVDQLQRNAKKNFDLLIQAME